MWKHTKNVSRVTPDSHLSLCCRVCVSFSLSMSVCVRVRAHACGRDSHMALEPSGRPLRRELSCRGTRGAEGGVGWEGELGERAEH